jgi:hypothetical protein
MHPQLIPIQAAVHAVLSPAGFKKHKTTWIRTFPDVRQVVTLDKESFSSTYRFAFGVNVRKIRDDLKPLFYRLHIRWNEMELFPEQERREWIQVSKLHEESISVEERTAKFAEVARAYVLPTLDLVDSIEKIKTFLGATKAPTIARKWADLSLEFKNNLGGL